MATTRHGRIRVTVKVRGHQYEHHFPPGTAKAVIKNWKLRERLRRMDDQPVARAGTLAGDVETYLATLQHRAALQKERTRHLAFWVKQFGTRARSTLTAPELAAALSALRVAEPSVIVGGPPGRSASHCNHVRIALSHLWTTLDGKNAPNPLRDVPGFTEPEPEARGLPYYLIDRILGGLTREWGPKGHKRPQKTRARLRVMADTGLTPAQMQRLQPADLRLEQAAVWVSRRLKGKGVSGSLKPLSAAGVEALREFARAQAFGPWSVQSANKAWRRACDQAMRHTDTTDAERTALLTARLYDLRHSFLTMVFQVTGNLHTTSELGDHRSTKTTRRYALAAIPAHLRAAVESLKGWHSQPPAQERPDKSTT